MENEIVMVQEQVTEEPVQEQPTPLTLGQMFAYSNCVLAQIKLYHLQTFSEAEHKALGKFYDEVQDMFDELFECAIAHFGRFNYEMVDYQVYNYHEGHLSKEILEELYYELNLCDCQELSDLKKIKEDILALISKTIYKLTLK
jgi:hypothetical protein